MGTRNTRKALLYSLTLHPTPDDATFLASCSRTTLPKRLAVRGICAPVCTQLFLATFDSLQGFQAFTQETFEDFWARKHPGNFCRRIVLSVELQSAKLRRSYYPVDETVFRSYLVRTSLGDTTAWDVHLIGELDVCTALEVSQNVSALSPSIIPSGEYFVGVTMKASDIIVFRRFRGRLP